MKSEFGRQCMRKHFALICCYILLFVIFLSACNESSIEIIESTAEQKTEESIQTDTFPLSEGQEVQEVVENETLNWPEITKNGIDENLFLKNLDIETLEVVATELQELVNEEVAYEEEHPEVVITEGFIRVFESERYLNVLAIGEPAMKPLYWIIYKSPYAGLYEYICAHALYELSVFDFTDDSGALTWSNSKEFIERFNTKILSVQK